MGYFLWLHILICVVRVRYGVFFVTTHSDLCSIWVTSMMHEILCYTGLCYNSTELYKVSIWTTLYPLTQCELIETEMSFWRHFHHRLHWKLSFWQLSVQSVMKIVVKMTPFQCWRCIFAIMNGLSLVCQNNVKPLPKPMLNWCQFNPLEKIQ